MPRMVLDGIERLCPQSELRSVSVDIHQLVEPPEGLAPFTPDLLIVSLLGATRDAGMALTERVHHAFPRVPVYVVTEAEAVETLEVLLAGEVADYLLAPLRPEEVASRLQRWLGTCAEARQAIRDLRQTFGLHGFIGKDPALLTELRKLPRFAGTEACVLILGETGTGKELCARAVHHLSPRHDGPFVALNAAALPADLVENELFGHEAGAYTSARGPQRGLVAEAEGGTLFLDEIDTLPLPAQVKLLRLLQEKEYRPLGARRNISANMRFIAASNTDLLRAVDAGRFRKDLFFRINVLPLKLPALHRRPGDIPLLARHFVTKHREDVGGREPRLSPDAVLKLQRYGWPGNVRELENVIERALVLSEGAVIRARDVELPGEERRDAAVEEEFPSLRAAKARLVGQFERDFVERMLLRHEGNITHAARAAGKNRRAFFALMKKYRVVVGRGERL